MLRQIIAASASNPLLGGLLAATITAWGVYAVFNTPLDAIPDICDCSPSIPG